MFIRQKSVRRSVTTHYHAKSEHNRSTTSSLVRRSTINDTTKINDTTSATLSMTLISKQKMAIKQTQDNKEEDADDSDILTEEDSSDDDLSIATPLSIRAKPSNRSTVLKARTNKAGLPVSVQKQLAEDIERDFQGITNFKKDKYAVAKICDLNPTVYGGKNTALRQKTRDKIKHWKRLTTKEYKEVLDSLGVWSASLTASQQEIAVSQTGDKNPPKVSNRATVSPDKSCSIPQSTITSRANQKATAPVKIFPASCVINDMNTHTIKVNTDHPEANREVMVYDIERVEGVGDNTNCLFKGFWICLPIDIRFILDDHATTHWKARVFSSNTVMLSIQAWNYSHLHDRDQFEDKVDTNVLEAIDGSLNDYANEAADIKEGRKWKHLLLEFPSDIELAAKPIHANAGDDEKLELDLIPIEVTHPKHKSLRYTSMYAAWKVARTDVKARKKGKVEKNDDISDAARLLEMLYGGVKIE